MILQETCFTMSSVNKTQQTNSLLKASKGLVSEWVRRERNLFARS